MNTTLAHAVELAPIVERVHGANHPELSRVRELTLGIADHPDAARSASLWAELRDVTDTYTLPADACEGFTGFYEALAAADAQLVG